MDQLNILYLEDDPRDVSLIANILESGFNINLTVAKNKEQYIEACQSNKGFDIILSDYKLPGFNAIGALEVAQSNCPEIPFLCISGAIGEERAVEILKLGATDYVLKDRMGRLLSAIERALREAEEKKALSEAQAKLKRQNEELRIAKDKAEESDRLKTSFLANLSHEIRTPMNGILGFSELAMELTNQSLLKEYLQVIYNSSEKLLVIFNNILDISMIETGQIKVHEKRMSLENTFNALFNKFYPHCKRKGLTLIKKVDNRSQGEFYADENLLNKVLTNLLDNAIKFTKSGIVEFEGKTTNDSLEVFVKDSGIGISSEFHTKVFERFHQVESDPLHNWGGNGLGLTISKSLLEKMNGKIWLKSSPGKGSTFFIKMPVTKSDNKIPSAEVKKNESDFSGIHVLIVEDEEYNFLLLKEILKPLGMAISHAKSGPEAIDMYAPGKFALILMDIRMPIMDGIQATKTIKEVGGDTPIIAIIAYTTDEDTDHFKNAGFDGSVCKPVRQNVLLETINIVLANR